MNKRHILLILLFSIIASPAIGQIFSVKTIFRYLNVPDTRRSISAKATEPKDNSSMVVENGVRNIGSTDFDPGKLKRYTAALPAWLAVHPAGKAVQVPENIFYLGPNYQQLTELRFSNGRYQFVDREEKIVFDEDLFAIAKSRYDQEGFNVYDKAGKCRYYRWDGKLVFNDKFGFTETRNKIYYKFYEGRMAGIADSTGKELLPAKFDDAEPFLFNNRNWFCVKKGAQVYFMESGNMIPLLETYNVYELPKIVAGRYWLLNGKVYDMISREELFSTIKETIGVEDKTKAIFYIEQDYSTSELDAKGRSSVRTDKQRIYFDNKGKLLLDQPILATDEFNDSLYIGRVKKKDTLINGMNYIMEDYGIFNADHNWRTKPMYDYLKVLDANHLIFLSKFRKGQFRPGVMDHTGNIVIPEGRFRYYETAGRPGKYLCIQDSASYLWDAAKNNFERLDKPYFYISDRTLQNSRFLEGISNKDRHYLLDTSYRLLDTSAYSEISNGRFGRRSEFIECYPYTGQRAGLDDPHYLFTGLLERVRIKYDGNTFDMFTDMDSIAPGMYMFKTPGGKHLVQTKPGEYFTTACYYLKYDPYFNWFIAVDDQRNWGILSIKGDTLMPFVFSNIKFYSQQFGTASLEYGEGKIQQLNDKGQLLFNGEYEFVQPLTHELFIVGKNGKRGLLKRDGREVLPLLYSYLEFRQGLLLYGDDPGIVQSKSLSSIK